MSVSVGGLELHLGPKVLGAPDDLDAVIRDFIDGADDEILALLQKNGIKPDAGPGPRSCARGTSTSVYFRDPDDNLVEFTVY